MRIRRRGPLEFGSTYGPWTTAVFAWSLFSTAAVVAVVVAFENWVAAAMWAVGALLGLVLLLRAPSTRLERYAIANRPYAIGGRDVVPVEEVDAVTLVDFQDGKLAPALVHGTLFRPVSGLQSYRRRPIERTRAIGRAQELAALLDLPYRSPDEVVAAISPTERKAAEVQVRVNARKAVAGTLAFFVLSGAGFSVVRWVVGEAGAPERSAVGFGTLAEDASFELVGGERYGIWFERQSRVLISTSAPGLTRLPAAPDDVELRGPRGERLVVAVQRIDEPSLPSSIPGTDLGMEQPVATFVPSADGVYEIPAVDGYDTSAVYRVGDPPDGFTVRPLEHLVIAAVLGALGLGCAVAWLILRRQDSRSP